MKREPKPSVLPEFNDLEHAYPTWRVNLCEPSTEENSPFGPGGSVIAQTEMITAIIPNHEPLRASGCTRDRAEVSLPNGRCTPSSARRLGHAMLILVASGHLFRAEMLAQKIGIWRTKERQRDLTHEEVEQIALALLAAAGCAKTGVYNRKLLQDLLEQQERRFKAREAARDAEAEAS